MRLAQLWLQDFRNYGSATIRPSAGLTAIVGANGQGKTNLLEAVGYLATMSSFRGVPGEAMVRAGCQQAIVRAEVDCDGRSSLVEAELRVGGRDRVLVNRQPLRRARDLLGTVRTTVFSPDDLTLVKGGPSGRRTYLDDLLVACAPRHDATRADIERVLRQRATLLKQAGGRRTPDVEATLDVWDAKLAEVGDALGDAREGLVARLAPAIGAAYDLVAGTGANVATTYDAPWRAQGLAAALAAARSEDLRRGVTTVGPHRDELHLTIDGLPARSHSSQGEQRSLALALRLAAHGVVTDVTGTTPVLLLDDVFSELDADRSTALVANLPEGQALLTTAGRLPEGMAPDVVIRVEAGTIDS